MMKVIFQDTCLGRSEDKRALIVAQRTCDNKVLTISQGVETVRTKGRGGVLQRVTSKMRLRVSEALARTQVLRFNLVRVEIRELRPEVVAESDEVLVHYRSRTNV